MTASETTASSPLHRDIRALIERLVAAWAAGSGEDFGRVFADRARFVAFDGTVLDGPQTIADFHQRAFSTHLKGSRLVVEIDEIRPVASDAALVFTHGGIEQGGETSGELIGASVQIYLVRQIRDGVRIEAFQNTRSRPITDKASAEAWKAFDRAWNHRHQPAETPAGG